MGREGATMSDTPGTLMAPPEGGGAPPPAAPPEGGSAPPAAAPPAGGDWKASLPESFRNTPSLSVFQGFESQAEMLEALGKSYTETKALVGKKLEAPGADATPEQIATWRKTVGAPDTPEGYGESLKPESFPDDQWSAESDKAFRELAHKHHLTPAAVKDIIGHYEKDVLAGIEQTKAGEAQYLATETAELKKAWGPEFSRNVTLAQRFAATLGLKPDNPIFMSSEIVQAMARGAALLSESKLVKGETHGIAATNQDRANAIMDSKNQDMLAREYRGEFGVDRQRNAQSVLHQLLQNP